MPRSDYAQRAVGWVRMRKSPLGLGREAAALFTPQPLQKLTQSVQNQWPALSGGLSYLNTAAASVAGCRVTGTVASDTGQSQVAEGTPPKGCGAERALVSCWGCGGTA